MRAYREETMSGKPEKTGGAGEVDAGRRTFLKTAGIGGAAAAVAFVAAPQEAEAQQFPPPPTTRYQRTPHVERFYALNRL
jgi:hypothetical protein